MNEFRADQYGNVYRYDQSNNAYLFCGKLYPDESLSDFVADYENNLVTEACENYGEYGY